MSRLERKKEKRKKFWMNIFLAAMFIFIIFGMTLGGLGSFGGGSDLKYGKYKFRYNDKYPTERYILELDKMELPFYFLPPETEYINLSSVVSNKIKESFFIMTTFDPDSPSVQEIAITNLYFSTYMINNNMNKIIIPGVLNKTIDYTLPVITCANATLKTPVILFNNSNSNDIVEKDNCIYLNARGRELLRLRDRLVYSFYGVIEDE